MTVGAVSAVALAASALKAEDAPKRPAEPSGNLIDAFNVSGFDIYKKLAAAKKDENVVVSPYSVGMAMSMVLAGARSGTEREMAKVLRQKPPREKMSAACAALLDHSNSLSDGETTVLKVANALCLTKLGDMVSPSYKKLLQDKYRAELFTAKDTGMINKWVSEKTNGKIKKILYVLNPLSVCVLLNAVYFKGDWENKFEERNTGLADFFSAKGETVKAYMMRQTGMFRLLERETFSVLEMPYVGGKLSMLILLPKKKGGLAELEKKIDANLVATLLSATAKTSTRELRLSIPVFEVKHGYDLIPIFKSLGMELPFGEAADFSGIAPNGGVFISQIQHKAYLKVDEEGSEAAAVTAVVVYVGIGDDSPPPPPAFTADHPFIFMIVDRTAGTVLFLGRLADPAAKNKE